MSYKWETPYEWLAEKAHGWDASVLYHELMILARQLDSDTLQDTYQEAMDTDGYFEEVSAN